MRANGPCHRRAAGAFHFFEMTGRWSTSKDGIRMVANQVLKKGQRKPEALHGPEQIVDLKMSEDKKTMMSDQQNIRWERLSVTR